MERIKSMLRFMARIFRLGLLDRIKGKNQEKSRIMQAQVEESA